MNKKYFFFDIDGTLTDKRTGLLVDSAVETIAKLKENGHFVEQGFIPRIKYLDVVDKVYFNEQNKKD